MKQEECGSESKLAPLNRSSTSRERECSFSTLEKDITSTSSESTVVVAADVVQ